MSPAPALRIDAPELRLTPASAARPPAPGADVRAVAASLCELLAAPTVRAEPLTLWRTGLRTAAWDLAAAGRVGAIPAAETARIAAVVEAAGTARVQAVAFGERAARLDRTLRDLADADHRAGATLLAFARELLAEARDLTAEDRSPLDLLPVRPVTRAERGAAAATLTAWVATTYRPLWAEADAVVAAALARDAGELLTGASDEHARRSAALLSVCERLPAAVARCAGRHHERLDGGGGPAGLTAADLTPADRLLIWADRFVAALPATRALADGERIEDPAGAWRAAWQAAAATTYAAARRGELCLTVAAAALASLGLSRGGQGVADAAGRAPTTLALTDLGRTRLRLDAAHRLAAPRYVGAKPRQRTASRDRVAAGAPR